ncbi:hypothetical protein F5Y15DRAFT_399188 [Xylariaceae sp. FL0016]|nr:hypothetical protein F5Y15DRAFT_399188 [Xylariaceae sp. FL0016]
MSLPKSWRLSHLALYLQPLRYACPFINFPDFRISKPGHAPAGAEDGFIAISSRICSGFDCCQSWRTRELHVLAPFVELPMSSITRGFH